jgi:conjugative transfer region protein TrbK
LSQKEFAMRFLRAVTLILLSVAAVHAARLAAQEASDPAVGPVPITDPLAKEPERCKALHEQASGDARCQAAYKESRRLFFQPLSEYRPAAVDMFPETRKELSTTDVKPNSAATGQ